MASVRQLKEPNREGKRPWVVEYTDGSGKRRRATPPSGLKKDAEKLRQRIEAEVSTDSHTAASETAVVSYVCAQFLLYNEQRIKEGQCGPSRHNQFRNICEKYLTPIVGKKRWAELSWADMEAVHRKMSASGLTGRSIKCYLRGIKQIDDYAFKKGFTKKHVVAEYLRDVRGNNRSSIDTFDVEEVRTLIATAMQHRQGHRERSEDFLRCIVCIAACCGLRQGEILALSLDNVDLENGVLKIRHALNRWDTLKSTKTRSGVRDYPMPSFVVGLLRNWIERHYAANDRELVFRGREGQRIDYNSIWAPWKRLLRAAGLSDAYHFHALRHFNASMLVDNGMPLADVAHLMGHATFDVTLQTYTHAIHKQSRSRTIVDGMSGQFVPTDATKTRQLTVGA